MGSYSGGIIIERIFASEIWEAYFREGLFFGSLLLEFYGICGVYTMFIDNELMHFIPLLTFIYLITCYILN